MSDNITIPREKLQELQKELDEFRLGGCGRDQKTTQYCQEAVDAQAALKQVQKRLKDMQSVAGIDGNSPLGGLKHCIRVLRDMLEETLDSVPDKYKQEESKYYHEGDGVIRDVRKEKGHGS